MAKSFSSWSLAFSNLPLSLPSREVLVEVGAAEVAVGGVIAAGGMVAVGGVPAGGDKAAVGGSSVLSGGAPPLAEGSVPLTGG